MSHYFYKYMDLNSIISMKKILNEKSLDDCRRACDDEVVKMAKEYLSSSTQVFSKLFAELNKKGLSKVFIAIASNDVLKIITSINEFIIQEDVIRCIAIHVKEFAVFYDKNYENINAVVDCYLRKCNERAIQLIVAIIELIKNVMNVLNHKIFVKETNESYTKLMKNIDHAIQRFKSGKVRQNSNKSSQSSLSKKINSANAANAAKPAKPTKPVKPTKPAKPAKKHTN